MCSRPSRTWRAFKLYETRRNIRLKDKKKRKKAEAHTYEIIPDWVWATAARVMASAAGGGDDVNGPGEGGELS